MLLGSSLIFATEATSLEAFWVQEEGAAPWSFCLSLVFKALFHKLAFLDLAPATPQHVLFFVFFFFLKAKMFLSLNPETHSYPPPSAIPLIYSLPHPNFPFSCPKSNSF